MDLAFLNPLCARPGPWASVYADTSRHTESTANDRRLEAQAAVRSLMAQGADEATCRAVQSAVEGLGDDRSFPGRAFFATEGEVVLDPPLLTAPPGDQACWGTLPRIAPLVELNSGELVCLVAYIDRKGADFELRGPDGARFTDGVTGHAWPLHRTPTGDWSERHFQNKVENTWQQNAALTAEAIAAHQQETRADVVILVGGERERRAVYEQLPQQVGARTVESPHGGRAAGADTRLLDEDVRGTMAAFEHRRVAEDLERFEAARHADGERRTAAEGVPGLVEAAREHRIAELLVQPEGADLHRTVWVGPDPDQLAVRRSDLPYLGERHPEPARADDALLRSAAATGAEALAVPPQGAPAGGLGALLRWA
ncbi:Vms1/Ankzf1 family peptidyl-tRNA hydrolase [Streptomyces indicus]|uniref:Peptide chain release factor 1 (ERF1) n=1 Tax=Streptomyces indicus TaxID=417292 RepID=A0A1G8TSK3_9ACTN|nr:Vms1/Ankzf1 family peptidyl-tRNA hydrolase [Streptomyces indicus]SDJ44423.1 hypothetical protein SAMN05421806_101427 [Streptomyces indicus]